MLRNRCGTVLQDVQRLFDSGTVGALTDAELLSRFVDRRDETAEPAFAALLERHGPMVLRVCRSVLRDDHDAQDAFQATFLILVRRADAVRNRESVGSWLYGVALRVSARARAAMARRRKHETRAAATAADRSHEERSPLELSTVLHEELGRLPDRYRAAVVLCYLEGQTCEAAARQLGWPVGTVKSRLARGRARLFARLIRRGLGPDESSDRSSAPAVMSAAMANNTARAMLRFAAGQSTVGLVSKTAIDWALTAPRTIPMTRLVMISSLLIAGLATTGAALLTPHEQQSAVPAKAAQKHAPDKPAAPAKKIEMITVRVIDIEGRDVPNVEVEVVEQHATSEGRRYRTGADGRFRAPVDPHYSRIHFLAHPDDRTIGWASITNGNLWPEGTDKDPVTLMLLPLNHRVEGSVVDSRGQPIRGVEIRPFQIEHEKTNGFLTAPSLGSAVTDGTGRFVITLPADTRVGLFRASHPQYVGPWFHCGAEDRTIAPVTLIDAGGIAGTVTDSTTGKPVEGALVAAGSLERGLGVILGGGGGTATSDAHGHFQIGGLAPGVYKLVFEASPRGRRFTARSVEGVRVRAGQDARADLLMIEGRRLHGTAIDMIDNTPMAVVYVHCESKSSHPQSGAGHQGTYTDDQGRFEFFVPPGPVTVEIPAHTITLTVPADRDPEPVRLENNPNGKPRPPARPFKVVECPVRVRAKTGEGKDPAEKDVRTLIGRIFDPEGSPIVGVRVSYSSKNFVSTATDRLGVFRLKGLPQGRFKLFINKDNYGTADATIPPDAWEVDLTLPRQPDAPE